MDKEHAVYTYNGILLSHKEERRADTCCMFMNLRLQDTPFTGNVQNCRKITKSQTTHQTKWNRLSSSFSASTHTYMHTTASWHILGGSSHQANVGRTGLAGCLADSWRHAGLGEGVGTWCQGRAGREQLGPRPGLSLQAAPQSPAAAVITPTPAVLREGRAPPAADTHDGWSHGTPPSAQVIEPRKRRRPQRAPSSLPTRRNRPHLEPAPHTTVPEQRGQKAHRLLSSSLVATTLILTWFDCFLLEWEGLQRPWEHTSWVCFLAISAKRSSQNLGIIPGSSLKPIILENTLWVGGSKTN